MEIVINIDENLYTRLFDSGDIDAVDMLKACVAIRKGIPLPKGHGVDVLDKIRTEIEHMIPCSKEALSMKLGVLEIIDKYKAESEEQA